MAFAGDVGAGGGALGCWVGVVATGIWVVAPGADAGALMELGGAVSGGVWEFDAAVRD